jgi:hypothetical protein
MLLAGAPFTSHCTNLRSCCCNSLLQQNRDIGETEGDVLKQANAVVNSARMLCSKYKEVVVAAAASKGDVH